MNRTWVRAALFCLYWSCGIAACLGYEAKLYVDRLPPLDMTAALMRSPVVLDRKGQLLRPFTTPDGIWRLPVKESEVDQRYLAMLFAYEDRRFRDHPGVDPHCCARRANWPSMAG
jgi:penicillin-binding protein 1C